MRAGILRHRITIENQSAVNADNYGGESLTWSTLDTVWAAYEPVVGEERWEGHGDQRVASATIRFRIRHRSDVTPKMRVNFDSNYYDIVEVRNVMGRDRETHLMCREVL